MNLIKSLPKTSRQDSKSIALRGNKAIKNARNEESDQRGRILCQLRLRQEAALDPNDEFCCRGYPLFSIAPSSRLEYERTPASTGRVLREKVMPSEGTGGILLCSQDKKMEAPAWCIGDPNATRHVFQKR